MKILMLTPYLPYPLFSGGQIRTYNLLKNLSKDHDITLFSLIKSESEREYIKELEKYCTKVRVFKRSEKPFAFRNILRSGMSLYPFLVVRNLVDEVKGEVEKELKNNAYDVIHAETFYMMPNIPKTKIPVILVEQTIEYLGYLSYARSSKMWFIKPLLYFDIFRIRFWEEFFWKTCTRLIAMSDQDKSFMLKTAGNISRIDVVENGIDPEFFRAKEKKLPKDPTLLFVGTFKWLPNIEAVQFLISKVWPLVKKQIKNAKLHIVGHSPTEAIYTLANGDKSIHVDGNVEDIREAYATAHALVAPVFSGKGTRYKVLESMATKTPVVGTSLAVEGLEIVSGKHAVIGNTAHELADQTIRLLEDNALREKLAREGEKFVISHYNWTRIADKLNNIYKDVGNRRT